jgi:quercetin dioxygenase-like cupin family protein
MSGDRNDLSHIPRSITMKYFRSILRVVLVSAVAVLGTQILRAQDPIKVDAKHYKVVFENDSVRVLRITYGPHEKSVMHDHPNGVAIFLKDFSGRFTFPDGKTNDVDGKAGQTIWASGGKHLPENRGDKPFELILVELKPHSTGVK